MRIDWGMHPSLARRSPPRPSCCAAILLLALGRGAIAQAPPVRRLPPCDSAAPASFPCPTRFDQAPRIQKQPALADTGDRRTPWVWMFVTAQGTVAAAQVERSAGFDFDLAAIGRAKQLEFAPAQLNGSSVPAWILLPLETTAAPDECPSMAVPVSAGMATVADSELLARPELGTLYRFVAMDNVALDITIYPRGEWPPPSAQVHDFIAALDSARDRGDFSAVEVQKQGDVRVKVRSGRPRHDMAIDGHEVRAPLTHRRG